MSDPHVEKLRGRIGATDRALVAALNARLELVRELKAYKAARGIDFVDPERERLLLDELAAANGGPLSEEGLRRIVVEVLALTKRELEDD